MQSINKRKDENEDNTIREKEAETIKMKNDYVKIRKNEKDREENKIEVKKKKQEKETTKDSARRKQGKTSQKKKHEKFKKKKKQEEIDEEQT